MLVMTSKNPKMPPQALPYGKRMLPSLLDELAIAKPDHGCIAAPIDANNVATGYIQYTFAQLANAVNVLAFQLEKHFIKSKSRETVAYLGLNDVRYIVITLALVKIGHTALLISPRNSDEAQVNLFEKTNCKFLVYDLSIKDTAVRLASKSTMEIFPISSAEERLHSSPMGTYPYHLDFEQARWDPFVVLHTSGSTGLPKPVILYAGNICIFDAYHDLPDFHGQPNWLKMLTEANALFNPMPMFHLGGLSITFSMALYYERLVLLPPTGKPMDVGTLEKCIRASRADATFVAPSMLEEMSSDPEQVSLLAEMKFVGTGSANVAMSVGNHLTKSGVNLQNIIGITEHSPFSSFRQDPEHWNYFLFQDEPSGFEWRHYDDDIYELWIVRKDKDSDMQAIIYTFPDLTEWSTRDLWKKHPTRPNNWTYYGRADNIIVLSIGEKINPVTLEDALTGHPEVRGALVVGRNRIQPVLLIEPLQYSQRDKDAKTLMEKLWPIIDQVNKSSVSHAKVSRSHVALIPQDLPFPRSAKGAIQRTLAEQTLKHVIDNVFENSTDYEDNGQSLDLSSEDALAESIAAFVSRQLDGIEVEANTDFFVLGMDSTQVLTLSRALSRLLKDQDVKFAARDLYSNPTTAQIARHVWTRLHGDANSSSERDEIAEMVKEYASIFPPAYSVPPALMPATRNLTIIVTGTTGSIGSYVLDVLNAHPLVKSVMALNRGLDSHARQMESSSARGLPTEYPKTTFLTVDLSQSNLGLSIDHYKQLVDSTDVILHSAWRVNFNLTLTSFEPYIEGTKNLVDLSLQSHKRPRIVFVTTIGECAGYSSKLHTVPEEHLHEHTMPAVAGYGASKLVASRLLDFVERKYGVPVAIVRVGQVAGPVDRPSGSWNRWEWFPSIVASSLKLGVLPDSLGECPALDSILWVPVERQAELLVDIAVSGRRGVFNGVNPQAGSYKRDVLPALKENLEAKKQMRVVSWAEWVKALEASEPQTRTAEEVKQNPGVKLLEFYKGMDSEAEGSVNLLRWSTGRSQEVSNVWRQLQGVHAEWVYQWLKQWDFS